MFVLVRALTYATVFVGFLLVVLPAQLLDWSGVTRPTVVGVIQIIGAVVTVLGATMALWCVLTFALIGRGTPAPFDPPRHLVESGPYRFVRNPMYLGAGLALAGAALFYGSLTLFVYAAGFMIVAHLFVTRYEERNLTRMFATEYDRYRRRVRRWLPTWRNPAA